MLPYGDGGKRIAESAILYYYVDFRKDVAALGRRQPVLFKSGILAVVDRWALKRGEFLSRESGCQKAKHKCLSGAWLG